MAVSKNATTVAPDPISLPADINSGVDPTALPKEGDIIVATTIPAETPNADGSLPSETLPQGDPIPTSEEIAANEAAVDAAFDAANATVEERVAKEESIKDMTAEELEAEFGFTVPETISFLRDALSRSKSPFIDKMNGLLDKLEETSRL